MSNNLRKKGPGRPPKADEIKMIERMDAIAAPEKIWQLLFDRCKDGDTQAIKTWLGYRYGQPRQMIETAIQTNLPSLPPIIKVVNPEHMQHDLENNERQIISAVLPRGSKRLMKELERRKDHSNCHRIFALVINVYSLERLKSICIYLSWNYSFQQVTYTPH